MNSRVKLTHFGLSKSSKDIGQHNESLFSHYCVYVTRRVFDIVFWMLFVKIKKKIFKLIFLVFFDYFDIKKNLKIKKILF
jgi:hypothetical protein